MFYEDKFNYHFFKKIINLKIFNFKIYFINKKKLLLSKIKIFFY